MNHSFLDKDMKILVWCMGHVGKVFANFMQHYGSNTIIGYTDTSERITGAYRLGGELFQGYKVYQAEEIQNLAFDCIVIASDSETIISEIKNYILVQVQKKCLILSGEQAINMIRRNRVIEKYEETGESELRETLNWLKEHEISVRNQWENRERIYYNVQFDRENGDFPYIDFKGKRMYFPKNYRFKKDGDKLYLINVLEGDQYPGSPHLYIEGSHKICQGDVIVDAGVAEGNFALTYIDLVSKAYLIESNREWLDALELTFKPYKQKVVFVPKYLSDEDTENSITLDTVVHGSKIDFIKMDIEGAETKALLGGIKTLQDNMTRLSVCTYHRKRDLEYIDFILRSLGYEVRPTEGYMFFLYDATIDETLDFRRGVIHAFKKSGGTDR